MIEITIELIRTGMMGLVALLLTFSARHRELKNVAGWSFFVWGFWLLFLGTLIDTTDHIDAWGMAVVLGPTAYQSFVSNIFGYLLGYTLIAIGTVIWIPGIIELHGRRKQELEEANREIRLLSGLLPICSHCKKIRNDEGGWQQLEGYIQEHSEAEFTHGICPECTEELYKKI